MSVLVEQDAAFVESLRRIADDVAAASADDVDRNARFPAESVQALREAGALGAFVPTELGGGGVSFEAIAAGCFELGRRCGASAMVFAMHQIQIVTIARHLGDDEWFEGYLREVAEDGRLVASVTSEVGTGGDMGRSVAAVRSGSDGASGLCSFEKEAPTVSYGDFADDLLVTLRRSEEAEPSDQVLALARGDQIELEQKGTWDPLGMRGTCSPGYVVRAELSPEQVLSAPFSRVMPESMVPVSHILWSHLWLGIATDAFERARSFVRAAAKRKPGEPLPAAQRLSHLMSELSLLRAEVSSGLREFTEASEGPGRERLSTMAAALRFNNLKIAASEQAPRVCQGALGVCGIVGFKNDTPFSVGAAPARHDVGLAHGRQRAHPPDQRRAAADRQGRLMAEFRAGTAEQESFLGELLAEGLLVDSGVPGVYGRGAAFEDVRLRFDDMVSAAAAPDGGETLCFPPLLPRRQLESSGYLATFPHLAGTVFAFDGGEAEASEQAERASRHEDWSEFQRMTDLMLVPAACYPVYPAIGARGPLPPGGLMVDCGGSCCVFRNEPSGDPARLQAFLIRELVRIGEPEAVQAWRDAWRDRCLDLLERVGLEPDAEVAADPFFGRSGRLLAASQREQALKFEVSVPIAGPEPTAVASFNYHEDHFSSVHGIELEGGETAHTACLGFGQERIVMALFRAHGLDAEAWPAAVRKELWPR